MTTICFNFASRSRPQKFYACLNNIREMVSSKSYYVLAKIDQDQRKLYDTDRIERDYPEVIIARGNSNSKVHAINRGLDTAPHFDILANHSDDMWFIKKGFDELIREHCTEDTFVHFPDQATGDKLCTYSIMDVIYFRRTGYVYNPAYKSLWADNEATEVAKALGRYKFIDEKILEHRHHAWGLAVKDAQYIKTESFYWSDQKVYENRKAINFDL